ncbi:MAG TPA: hypothetical protein VGA99_15600 [bacterium]
MNESKIIKSEPAAPDTKSWYEHFWKAEQDIPNRIEDAAKFLATMISISFTLFLVVGKDSFENLQDRRLVFAAGLWLVSLLAAFFVVYPFRYRYAAEQVQSIRKMHRKVVIVKRTVLIVSLACFVAALVIVSCLFFNL